MLLDQPWKNTEPTPRVQKLYEMVLTKPAVCVERGRLYTESYRETESDPTILRRAKALKKVLDEIPIRIDEGELIVGKTTTKPRGGAILPEVRADWLVEELTDLSDREWDQMEPISEEEKEIIRQFAPYWKGKSRYDKWEAMLPGGSCQQLHEISIGLAHCDNNMHGGHMSLDFAKLLKEGLGGVKEECRTRIASLREASCEEYNRILFYRSVLISLDALSGHILRYAKLAEIMAGDEKDPQRKEELNTVAATCRKLQEAPAETFYEAIQLIWFAYLAALQEGWGMSLGFGRFDQYMYPFYEKDLKEGRLTREGALELIELFIIKINSSIVLQSADIIQSCAGFLLLCNLTIAGTGPDGADVTNEVSHLVVEAEYHVAGTGDDIAIRVSDKTPKDFVRKALLIARDLHGKFKWVGDKTGIDYSMRQGKPEDIARDFCVSGCVAMTTAGRTSDLAHGYVNFPLFLELALNNGVSRLTGKQLGPRTGDPRNFTCYEDVWNAYLAQVEALLPVAVQARNLDQQVGAELTPCPFQAAFYGTCLERAKDVLNGGVAPYMVRTVSPAGIPNVSDSLAAIKKTVFEDGRLTMSELIDALDHNYEGYDRAYAIISRAPKFGNDDEYVDSIADAVLTHAYEIASSFDCYLGSKSLLTLQTTSSNMPLGAQVGALPDGRRAGDPLSEGGISPHPGRNVSGTTATINSVNRVDLFHASNGSLLNMRFNPSVFKDEESIQRFVSMMMTYFNRGGYILQFNFVDAGTLRAAQREPEKYKDLLVRVATYSAYFVELSRVFQDNIIERVEFESI